MEAPGASGGEAGAAAAASSRLTIVRVKRRRTEAAQETLSARPRPGAASRFRVASALLFAVEP